MKRLIIVIMILCFCLVGCKDNKENVVSNSGENNIENFEESINYKEIEDNRYDIKQIEEVKTCYSGDNIIIKQYKYINDEEFDLYWKFHDNPEIILKNDGNNILIECFGNFYSYYINDNFVSVIFDMSEYEKDYYPLTADLTEMKILTNEEILNIAGKTDKEMNEIIKNATIKYIEEKAIVDANSDEDKERIINNTKSKYEENANNYGIGDSTKYFFNENGDLCFIAYYPIPMEVAAGVTDSVYFYNCENNSFIED